MKRILITAGPTRERIDEVRFLSNRSTGRMGYAMARAAREAGHDVVLVSGPTALTPPEGVTVAAVESAAEMAAEVKRYAASADVVVMAAAVADYRPRTSFAGKLKKTADSLVLELERTEDILAALGRDKRPGQLLVGFAAECENLEAYAAGKLVRKNLDWIAANDIAQTDRGFGSENNAVLLLGRSGARFELPLASKLDVARRIFEIILS